MVLLSRLNRLSHLSWWRCTWTTVLEDGLMLGNGPQLYICVWSPLRLGAEQPLPVFHIAHFCRPIYYSCSAWKVNHFEVLYVWKIYLLMRDQLFRLILWFRVFDVGHVSPGGRVLISTQTYHIKLAGNWAGLHQRWSLNRLFSSVLKHLYIFSLRFWPSYCTFSNANHILSYLLIPYIKGQYIMMFCHFWVFKCSFYSLTLHRLFCLH